MYDKVTMDCEQIECGTPYKAAVHNQDRRDSFHGNSHQNQNIFNCQLTDYGLQVKATEVKGIIVDIRNENISFKNNRNITVTYKKVRLFADGCIIYRQINDESDISALQNDLNAIETWTTANKIKINVSKKNMLKISPHIIRYHGMDFRIDRRTRFKSPRIPKGVGRQNEPSLCHVKEQYQERFNIRHQITQQCYLTSRSSVVRDESYVALYVIMTYLDYQSMFVSTPYERK
ncbi:hypothetical protein ANN_01102 [Periplaneta americana]|uniref:Uncharacterized protein n=1 Tax=Periplaneta americana TaxID=6978 RepID=A0ABQ8TSM2_PERAM|nr:hypothetical protein ANN_01102 [Periplaneta americana]